MLSWKDKAARRKKRGEALLASAAEKLAKGKPEQSASLKARAKALLQHPMVLKLQSLKRKTVA